MEVKKILIIRFRRVGDATLSVTLCTSLRKTFPGAEVHYILNHNIAPLFEGHPDIDKIITFSDYDMENTKRYLKKVWDIMHENFYDIIIDTRATMKTLPFSFFSLQTPYRIGRKKKYSAGVHNYRIDNYPDRKLSNVDLTLQLLDPLAESFPLIKDTKFKLYVPEAEKQQMRKYMESMGIDFSKPVIICGVTARLEWKVWNKQKMQQVLKSILDKYEHAQLIFNYGGEREKESVRIFYDEMGKPSRVFIDIEAKDLKELRAMISLSDFYFGNEGGPRHIAQALEIPSFAIFPPNANKATWLPNPSDLNKGIEVADIDPLAAYDKNLSFEQKMNIIDTESVWTKLDGMLYQSLHRK